MTDFPDPALVSNLEYNARLNDFEPDKVKAEVG
jgi:hypothetical protein